MLPHLIQLYIFPHSFWFRHEYSVSSFIVSTLVFLPAMLFPTHSICLSSYLPFKSHISVLILNITTLEVLLTPKSKLDLIILSDSILRVLPFVLIIVFHSVPSCMTLIIYFVYFHSVVCLIVLLILEPSTMHSKWKVFNKQF